MPPTNGLIRFFEPNNGIVKTAQVLEIGIAKSTFYICAKQFRDEKLLRQYLEIRL